jgi:coenzyme F420 hydrogenase subunit beta
VTAVTNATNATNALEQVVADGFCAGCGLCRTLLGEDRVRMEITPGGFLRPRLEEADGSGLALEEARRFQRCCPGVAIRPPDGRREHRLWGPLIDLYRGHAGDQEVRHRGSSGGALSALLLDGLETGAIDFVWQTGADPACPLDNRTAMSVSRVDVLAAAGSRYGPSAPLAELGRALADGRRFAFVGKPCDVAGLRAFLAEAPQYRPQVALVVSFFCAGVPSRRASEELLARLGVDDPTQVSSLRYRGFGWPGRTVATMVDGRVLDTDYDTAWGTVLNRGLQPRCRICPDGTGELADVSFADAWELDEGRPCFRERPGQSLVLVRTPAGRAAVARARDRGALIVGRCDVEEIERMQPYQADRKRVALARILGVGLLVRRRPRFRGLGLLRAAATARFADLLWNVAGTVRRWHERSDRWPWASG